MDIAKKMGIKLIPCCMNAQKLIIDKAILDGSFNKNYYDKLRDRKKSQKVEINHERETGIRFIYEKVTDTLQAYRVGLERFDSIPKRCE